jgi:hypothetical protein
MSHALDSSVLMQGPSVLMVRVQGPAGNYTVSVPRDAPMSVLREQITIVTGIAANAQELLVGFPPQALDAADAAQASTVLGGDGARVLVRAAAAAAAAGGGGGRKKPLVVRRIVDGVVPRDLPAPAPVAAPAAVAASVAGPSGAGAAADDVADDDDAADDDEPRAGVAAAASAGRSRKRKKADPLALTLAREKASQVGGAGSAGGAAGGGGAGGGGGGAGTAAAPPKVKALTAEQLATDYYSSSGSAMGAAARGGGRTTDFLSEHGMIEHRTAALASVSFVLAPIPPKGKGCPVLSATFKAVRKSVCEHVQLLSRDELKGFLRVLSTKGSSRRGTQLGHLLTPAAMAARSPAVFWSMAFAFDGDVEGGVKALLAEL